MRFTYFLSFFDRPNPARNIGANELERVAEIVRATPGLQRGLIYNADHAVGQHHQPDGAPPQLGIQLYFDELEALESALAREGHLQKLAAADVLPSLVNADVEQQAMVVHQYDVPEPALTSGEDAEFCTFLVHYPGSAQDLNEWLDYYIVNHPPVMRTFPKVREVEICTRLDWRGFLPWLRVDYMQRNKIAFDNADDLIAALNSPVRDKMAADSAHFPPFEGGSVHLPVTTRSVLLK